MEIMKCDFLSAPWNLKVMGLSVILAIVEDEEAMVTYTKDKIEYIGTRG